MHKEDTLALKSRSD